MSRRFEQNEQLRENIKTAKDELNLTLKKIGDATGKSDASISRMLSGSMAISESWVEQFCEAYHIDKDWLMNGTGTPVFTKNLTDIDTKNKSGAGKRLRQLREELGLKQQDMAEVVQIARPMYGRIENGFCGLTEENAQKIEDRFGVGAEWILYGDDERKNYPIGRRMIEWLWKHEDERKRLWRLMEEED